MAKKDYLRQEQNQEASKLTPEIEAMINEFDEKLAKAGIVHMIFVKEETGLQAWGRASLDFMSDVVATIKDVGIKMAHLPTPKERSDG